MPSAQVWYLSAQGGYFANPKLSMNMHTIPQPMVRFRQFTNRENQFGKSMGDTLDYNKVYNIVTAGGQLTEGVPIPKSNITISRGQVIAQEYGNSIPWTSKLETLSEFSIDDPIQNALLNDRAKVIDRVVYTELATTKIKYVPQGVSLASPIATWETTSSTVSATATRDIGLWDLKNGVDALRRGVFGSATGAPIEPWDGQDYVALGSVPFCRALFDDPDFEEAAKYGSPDLLFKGEVGRIYGCRVVMENNIMGTLGTSGYSGEAFIFGKETVKEIRVVPEEIRRAIPGDYGRDKGMAWYAILGFDLIWNYNATTEPVASVIHLTSA